MGVCQNTFSQKINVMLAGVEGCGKTFLLYSRIKQLIEIDGKIRTKPTLGFNYEEIKFDSKDVAIWDLPGRETLRDFWPMYYKNIHFDGIIFLIDYENKTSFDESVRVMHELFMKEELSNSNIILLINKGEEDPFEEEGSDEEEDEEENTDKKKKKELKRKEILEESKKNFEKIGKENVKQKLYFDMIPQINKDIFFFELYEKRKPGDKQFQLENKFREFLANID